MSRAETIQPSGQPIAPAAAAGIDTSARRSFGQPYPALFAPIQIGRTLVKNRVMRVATTSNLAERNRVGERMLAFYRTVAEGGAGFRAAASYA